MIEEKRYLGIDFGEKRIGLALTDPMLTFAYPFETIPNDIKVYERLKRIVEEYLVVKIVMGMPEREDGKEASLKKKITEFAKKITELTGIEIIFRDERYTSSIAYDRIIESVSKKSKRKDKGLIDKNAAAIILSDYLEEKSN